MENEVVTISKFKATCLALLKRVKETREPLLVTKKGEPIALVTPPPPPYSEKNIFGCMRESITVHGDIISPLPKEDWEVLRS